MNLQWLLAIEKQALKVVFTELTAPNQMLKYTFSNNRRRLRKL